MEDFKIIKERSNTKVIKSYTMKCGMRTTPEEVEYIEEEDGEYYYITAAMRIKKDRAKEIEKIKQRKTSLLVKRIREKENQERTDRMNGKIPK